MDGLARHPAAARSGILLGVVVVLSGCAGSLRPSPPAAPEAGRRQAMQYFVQAKVYESQGNPLGAIVALRSAADLDPSPTIYAQLARNYERIQDYRMAVVFARHALDLDPELTPLRYRLVRWLESAGTPREVAVQMRELIRRDPGNWQLYSHLARVYMEAGEEGRIDNLFDHLLEDPDTPLDVRVNVAYVLSRTGHRQRAEGIFRRVLGIDPTVEDAWLGLGEMQVASGDSGAALASYREGARRVPDSSLLMYELARMVDSPQDLEPILQDEEPAYLYRLGVALSEMDKYPLAARVFERIVGYRPTTVEGWLEPVRYYLHVSRVDRAEEILRQAVTVMPDSLQLYLFWGRALEEAQRPQDALVVYRRAAEQVPDALDLYMVWGWNLEERQLWDAAVDVYRHGLVAAGEHPELYIRWGIVMGRQGRWQEAIGRFRKAADLAPDQAEAHLHWGVALQRLRRWDEAVARLTRALDLTPPGDDGLELALFYLGSALEQASRRRPDSDDFDRAVATFRRLLDLWPDDAYALNYLGYSFAERGVHLDEAVELLNRALRLEPDNGAFLDSLGWAYFKLGDLDQAERYLAQALEHTAQDDGEEQAVILDHAGDIAAALGKHQEARRHWQRALDFDPGNDDLRRKLEAR